MKYTNKYKLPFYLQEWVEKGATRQTPDPKGVSVTKLIDSMKVRILTDRHFAELESDISDYFASMTGSAIHRDFEDSDISGMIQEPQLAIEVNGMVLTGRPDFIMFNDGYQDCKKIGDIKTTSVWKYQFNDYADFIKQMSVYRWMLASGARMIISKISDVMKTDTLVMNGNMGSGAITAIDKKDVPDLGNAVAYISRMLLDDEAIIQFWFTDWAKKKARADKMYPQTRFLPVYVNLQPLDQTEKYVKERIDLYAELVGKQDDEIPECTPAERWQKGDKFAVYTIKKDGNTAAKATRVFDTLPEVGEYLGVTEDILADMQKIDSGRKDYFIEKRPGSCVRCMEYCAVKPFCHFGRRLTDEENSAD